MGAAFESRKYMIDLHVHSNRSDGTLSPSELVDYAIEKGLNAFALTDHDTTAGLDEAVSHAESLRQKGVQGVPRVIKGIELSTDIDGKDVHIVGLFINPDSAEFREYLKDFVDERVNRDKKMCVLLQQHGIDVTYEKLTTTYPDTVITRAHFAMWMLNNGFVKTKAEAFEKYIGDGAPCYVNREKVTPEMAVELILKADGVPIFAHPILCKLPDDKLEALIKKLKDCGLMGIEAEYTTYSQDDSRKIRRLAQKYHLLLSGGSDFHGSNKINIDLGTGYGNLYVDDSILKNIESARKNILFTDLDGTLFLNDSTISDDMRSALKRLTSNGHRLVIASGRPLPSILERIDLLDMRFDNMYVISNNGSLITELSTGKKIFEEKLPPSLINKIAAICNEKDVHVHSYSETEIVGYDKDAEFDYYHTRIHMPFVMVKDLGGYLKEGAYKVQVISLDKYELLKSVGDEILCKLGDRVEAVYSSLKYLEILPKGIGKGISVKRVASLLSMPMSHTFAAGDAGNDITMIQAAGTGIAMANAIDEVKAIADIVTAKTNNEDGLIEIIDKYFG